MSHRANVLRAYRDLLDLIKRQPQGNVQEFLAEARTQMKSGMGEIDPLKASDMLKQLVGRVSFLHMTTPRQFGDRRSRTQSAQYVVRDGDLTEGEAEDREKLGPRKMNADEAYRKHKELTKRQYFGRDPPPVMPPF